jgi:hypothetical protein
MSKHGFLEGFASVLNLFPVNDEEIIYTPVSDMEAYAADRDAIAKDMMCAIHIYTQHN